MRPQTVVLFATPKFVADFSNPAPDVGRFLDHYAALTTKSAETIVIFSVGNSDHILRYEGKHTLSQNVDWARVTDGKPVFTQKLSYQQIAGIVTSFRQAAAARGLTLKVYDQIDSGNEFTITNDFKYHVHPECIDNPWHSYDVGAVMGPDGHTYATQPGGMTPGTLCGDFLVDQTAVYLEDLGFDGILYDNQLGTRGRWETQMSPGFSISERNAISHFLRYTEDVLGAKGKEVMWFDSYNRIEVETTAWSFPMDGYARFDYLIASGFCVITNTDKYRANLRSKLTLRDRTKVLATLDYVDPWYSYRSMSEFTLESMRLEQAAIDHRFEIDGIVFFAHDSDGSLVPQSIVESFAARFHRP